LIDRADLVERIWARDPTVWTGGDEAHWLGWLDEPSRLRERTQELCEFAERTLDEFDACVLLGMGGSSLAPEVLRRAFRSESFHVLDTTHPSAIRRLESSLDLERTLFVAASKSGGTIETRSHLEYFWEKRSRGANFACITDPGSELDALAGERDFRAVFHGEPTIGGRYSALSVFGLVPAAIMGVRLGDLLDRAEAMVAECRGADANPGVELGIDLGEGWRDGRDKICIEGAENGFGLWIEQLIAESTGKQGKGLVPAPGEGLGAWDDRQIVQIRWYDEYNLGAEFFRWEFATAVVGAILGINPFDQPDVQAAKDRTSAVLQEGKVASLTNESSVDELLAQVLEGDYVAIQAFIDPAREEELEPIAARARETGAVVTVGLGPRYLHSTGQLHKGGPNTVLCLQVVDDLGEELPIPGQKFGFRRLIAAQAAGDYEALKERGRRVARITI
jgi:transaldolase/glucose-6-phosphate isomerase